MAASRKKRTKPRAGGASKKRVAAGGKLKALDAQWRSFITQAAGAHSVTAQWPDPQGRPFGKPFGRSATRKSVKKKTTRKAAGRGLKAKKAKKAKKK